MDRKLLVNLGNYITFIEVMWKWSSLVSQLLKNLPAMLETWVQSLGWDDPLEKGMATHYSILAWGIHRLYIHGVANSQTWLSDFHNVKISLEVV